MIANSTFVQLPTRTLIFGMAHEDGRILCEELLPVARACEQSDSQVRSCLRRMVAEGLLEKASGAGASAVYDATPRGKQVLSRLYEKTRLAYGQDAAGIGWDRKWHLVFFAIPETKRIVRDRFRDRLLELGGGQVQPGLYVSPHDWHEQVVSEAERLSIQSFIGLATTDDLSVGSESDPKAIANKLWQVNKLYNRYQLFADELKAVPEALAQMRDRHEQLGDELFLSGALAVAVAFQECFEDDPLLPPELLPRPWPGQVARELLVQCRKMALKIRVTRSQPVPFRYFDSAVQA